MNLTHHTDYLKLESVLLKPVSNAFRSDELLEAQWEALHFLAKPELKQAINEYTEFMNILEIQGVEVRYLPPKAGLSIDSIYCRDASVATDFGMIICHMGKPERIHEPAAQKDFYERHKIPVLGSITAPGTLEGGDIAWLDKGTLAVGHTYRTNKEGIRQLKQFLEPRGIQVIVAELPHYRGPDDVFHLMSVFSPVDEKLAVVYSPLIPVSFRQELIRRGFDLVEVPDNEFETMACNVLALGPKTCVMLKGNPVTEKRLKDKGCQVFTYTGNHISLMGGGGPTCLTRPLQRSF